MNGPLMRMALAACVMVGFGLEVRGAVPAASAPAAARMDDPKGLSLHGKGQSLLQVADALQRQVGPAMQVSAAGLVGGMFTIERDGASLSELTAELEKQSPLCISVSPRKAGATVDAEADVFLIRVEVQDNPNLRPQSQVLMLVDVPRRGIVQRSRGSEITNATDQDGKAFPFSTVRLSGADFTSINPPSFEMNVSKQMDRSIDVMQVKKLKELEGTLEFGLLEKATVHTVDLQKPLVPLKTAQGTFTVSQAGATITVAFEPPAPMTADTHVEVSREDFLAGRIPAQPLHLIPVRVYDKEHKLLVEGQSGVMGGLVTAARERTRGRAGPGLGVGRRRGDAIAPMVLTVPANAGMPATVEIVWPETIRPVTFALKLHDVPVKAVVAQRMNGIR